MKCLMNVIFPLFCFVLLFGLYGVCTCQEYNDSSIISPMEEKEREGLYSTIQGFVGEWWNGSDLYPDPCGWTPIEGVSCDLYKGLWYVTSIKIGSVFDNSLNCSPHAIFSHQLFEFNHLNSLSFYNCFIKQNPTTIPTSSTWEKLANNLETLEFRSNPGLIGEVTNLGCLRNLRSLVLLENGQTGQLPTTLGDFVNLQKLVISGNSLRGQIPDSLGGLTKLIIVDLNRNSLSGQLPLTFGGLTSLLKLDLSHNFLGGDIPEEIGNLKNLSVLDLSNNNFSGGLIRSFHDMVSLEELVLSNNPIGRELNVVQWGNLQKLQFLDLSNMALIGNIPESLAKVKRLRYIGLKNNNLSGSVSPAFEAMPCLGAFYLQGNNCTGKLGFSQSFYRKMGSRFRASENENLCFSSGLIGPRYVPFGVKPCQEETDDVRKGLMKKFSGDDN